MGDGVGPGEEGEEEGEGEDGAVLVRDSKDKAGPHLTFSPTAWQAFVDLARTL
ncbi:DUF397 domain-containing protein [Kitasatospora aureofaciens]|uniref:DUF397 domain-containing protein n=1 Tax=Kitasatospora aureofaciens TaxID=1894 RepID=UPI0027DF0F79|nr:DUF397 domain-containing protein [Kitasatospora aureofaciens]